MVKGFIVYPTYEVVDNNAIVYLFGRLENGDSFLVKKRYKPYFQIKTSDLKKALKIQDFKHEKAGFKDFDDKPTTKVMLDIPANLPKLKRKLVEEGIDCYEADIRFPHRFLIDHDIKGSLEITGKHEKGDFVDGVYDEPELKPVYHHPELKVASIDIETNQKHDKIYSISIYTKGFKKTLIISDKKLKNAVSCKDESELLRTFKDKILQLDPDVITGWNVIDFDLKVIKERMKKHHLPFMIGRASWPCKLRLSTSFFTSSNADIPGRVVLDGIDLLKNAFIKLDNYKLDTAAEKYAKEKKLIGEENKGSAIDKAFKQDKQKLADYNLKDSELVDKIITKSGAYELTIQKSLITGMELNRVSASIASLDSLYIRELRKRKIVAPSVKGSEREKRIKGGYVMSSKPGIYTNILVLDFKSLYPSIMRSFNIDPYSYIGRKTTDKRAVKAPNGAYFKNIEGVMPVLIQDLWAQRDKAKRQRNETASYAIKILMNSLFGVLANPVCRFYSLEVANAITHFGQYLIKQTSKIVESMGYEVIYGDTDSIFVNPGVENYDEAKKVGREIEAKVNTHYKSFVKKEYKRENFMELEFEKIYAKFLMPKVRHSEQGAKKRYAGLLRKDGKEEIDFTGLEFVRSDWTSLAKEFQLTILDKIFHEREIAGYVKNFVNKLKAGKMDDLLIYRKSIRKPLESYVKTTPPHVKAARMLKELKSNIILYVQTVNGPEPVDFRKSEIDYEHYIEKQVKPIADSVLTFYDLKFDDLIKGKQKKLFDY